jgi:hypothetical protein
MKTTILALSLSLVTLSACTGSEEDLQAEQDAAAAAAATATASVSTCGFKRMNLNGTGFGGVGNSEYICTYEPNAHGWVNDPYQLWTNGAGQILSDVDHASHLITYTIEEAQCQVIVKVNGTKWFTLTEPVLDSNNNLVSFHEMYQMDLTTQVVDCSFSSSVL